MRKVLFIGLSDKVGCTPLQSDTRSGQLIDRMIENLNADCHKINLVNFAPLDEKGKLRYPNRKEMDKGYKNLITVLESVEPDICVLLGEKVSKYLSDKIIGFVSIQHPSYISVFKHTNIDDYVYNSVKLINLNLQKRRSYEEISSNPQQRDK